MGFPTEFYNHLKEHNYTEIKGGITRTTFLEIWVVAVEGRVFARSWNKSERSWYTAFLETGTGQLKYGDTIIDVIGEKIGPGLEIHKKINKTYRDRYTEKENIYYADGISQPEYEDYTMEFFIK
ncbi:uncharacterized protein DUF2255 [Ulvibacter sp. MAR_2010_11]|uniref:DUF2255 family protein n=1 Tax=Ulvibacter sp. MAR_2010_11 TaxID=1250229 RepID=UPI000C2BCDA7|nr:DUF2255 family protein [Ulvibacter sp. MAR_2010_11]PKA82738.1 uncharacterized protein DUF2255 [Ulvibacter sp. MAR_2010_11]